MATAVPAGLTPDTAEAVRLLLAHAERRGIHLVITSGKRSCAEQDALYAKGRTAPGPRVTDAKGCGSWHVLGRAVDVLVKSGPADYAGLADYWKALGGAWGGDFKGQSASLHDVGHFEYHPGLKYASEVCGDGCAINQQANAPKFWPEDPGDDAGSGGESNPGTGWFLLGLGALAVGIGLWAGRSKR